MWSTCSLLARAGITCYSFHALCITTDRIGLTAAAVQECAQPHLHSGHAPYYNSNQMGMQFFIEMVSVSAKINRILTCGTPLAANNTWNRT
jgi:hypothetical protein